VSSQIELLLHEQVQNLTVLHALNQVIDEELDLLIQEAGRHLNQIVEHGADQWYQEKDPVKAEHHLHHTRHQVKSLKHDLLKTVHTHLLGRVEVNAIHPEHKLERLHAKLRKHLGEEKRQLHKKIADTHKQIQTHHKQLPSNETEQYAQFIFQIKQLQEHIKNKTLPHAQIEQQLHSMPTKLLFA